MESRSGALPDLQVILRADAVPDHSGRACYPRWQYRYRDSPCLYLADLSLAWSVSPERPAQGRAHNPLADRAEPVHPAPAYPDNAGCFRLLGGCCSKKPYRMGSVRAGFPDPGHENNDTSYRLPDMGHPVSAAPDIRPFTPAIRQKPA